MNQEISVIQKTNEPMITPLIPILLESFELVQNVSSRQMIFTGKFTNLFPRVLMRLGISLECRTHKGQRYPLLYWYYNNLFQPQNGSFGDNISINLPYNDISRVKVRIVEVVYDRGFYPNISEADFQKIQKKKLLSPQNISMVYKTLDKERNFHPDIPFVYEPVFTENYWICRCGTVNSNCASACRICSNPKEYSDTLLGEENNSLSIAPLFEMILSRSKNIGTKIISYTFLLLLFISAVLFLREIISKTDNSSKKISSSSSLPSSYGSNSYYTPNTNPPSAYEKAQSYLRYMAFSRESLIDQLEFEGFTKSEAEFAVDLCSPDWQDQALKKALSYLSYSAFSREGLIDQLEFEGFSKSEALYAVNNCGADWNEQAVKKANEYRKHFSFTYSEMVRQLEVAEDFTHSQAVYGASH